jgi:predicted P-loop ATPase/GTPase
MSKFGYTILDEQVRREAIINNIKNHPGCTAEDIDKLQGKDRGNIPGHTTLYKKLNDLKSENIIVEKRLEKNRRNITLYVNENSQLVIVPDDINEFEQVFKQFIRKVVKRQARIIHSSSRLLDEHLEQYKEHLAKNMDERLTMHELEEISIDADLHTDLDLLSVQVSPVVKAIQILNEFMRAYAIRYIVEWSITEARICSFLLTS